MFTSDFDYNLSKELIAQTPISPRDNSRLMIVDKRARQIQHKQFKDIVNYLSEGDLLVWNNSKVFKARLTGTIMLDEKSDNIDDWQEKHLQLTDRILNAPSQVEIFLVRPMENKGVWKVLAKPGRKLRLGMKVVFAEDFSCEIMAKEDDGVILAQFNDGVEIIDDAIVRAKANQYGSVPTPPYINRPDLAPDELSERYQTVYAKAEGSVAAPTAGFHFTPELIEALKNKGVQFAEITLHVGLGTFLPVKTEKIKDHKMHSEYVEITASNADKINQAKDEGRRVVAVGTTTVRTLEGLVEQKNRIVPYTGDVNIFITPGFKFKIIDGLITNFHLPKSTLLMLVSAFASDRQFILDCYARAVEHKYRFYSFGDAMLIK
ncbi:MAG: tRNA preQ1(34) S-adenosylmethionine ribosyltransferase-isomerase QueA [Candidatus Magasanikbacteria bacterium CG10_big_fil_rev_8_21_14_0_10_40_10]|uniref:S-adenosylmethionine:tRNA ribosyltransferase-isomerase n=1 Tax=Candidatus Magasanikbacteria bacterium CG10_big_fil_rev_8_21_14_0_10_40_10 TaxID=1974648 RepID=A0A2M6W4E3_9BACT|nr:MAG: tRNA preQ1(34) S-adenosylmethionine ribosyltransferase-isomerase QueA [Candidatus Magasanikbacteria bacterium CG10_big_fil_rev_8_21_14_0_10_40_10]